MPGRQAHGRPLLGSGSGGKHKKNSKKTRAKVTATAHDAFAIAEEQTSSNRGKGVRMRALDDAPEPKRRRQSAPEDGDEDGFEGFEDDGEEDGPQRKRARRSGADDDAKGSDYGSDSEGNEWHFGVGGEDEDSDIDSDDAFDEADEERFAGVVLRGSSAAISRPRRKQDVDQDDDLSEDDDEDEFSSLGDEAIDLAQALDDFSEDDEEEEGGASDSNEDAAEQEFSGDEDDEDENDDGFSGGDALQDLVAGFADNNSDGENSDVAQGGKVKLTLKDLGLSGIKDAEMKRSLKLMKKEEKSTKPGSTQKLEVPLAKRQQDRLLRAAAYEKANETLDRWNDTVKQNRRADHLVFPLAQTQSDKGLDNLELAPLTAKAATSELEQTILSIMEQSGLGPSSKQQADKAADAADEEEDQGISRSELRDFFNQKRREREQFSREQARAKRIKKIKSKAYRRIHRKERLGQAAAEAEADAQDGLLNSDDETEAQDRRRALERVGAKHKDSKWAKMAAKTGRAAWDDDFREGLKDMARKDEELRRRVEGKTGRSDDEDDHGSDASDLFDDDQFAEKRRLRAELEAADGVNEDGRPKSKLMQMKFMQRGEEALKKSNDELVRRIQRDLDSDAGDSEEEIEEVGRRQYGMAKGSSTGKRLRIGAEADLGSKTEVQNGGLAITPATNPFSSRSGPSTLGKVAEQPIANTNGVAGAWSTARPERKDRKAKGLRRETEELHMDEANAIMQPPKKQIRSSSGADDQAGSGDDDDALHLPLAIRDQTLLQRAFAGDEVVDEFEREKAEVAEEDDEKVIDNTLPGWGSWVGDGVSNREKRRHQGRFLTKKDGVKKEQRKDSKLERVIVNEKRVRKTEKYLASQLPHPFESKMQYERSLRLPVGPEWMTKESFQASTKPRVIIKQGIIAPMAKPMV